ncbi:CHAP domain-containing protein [Pontixanthobacter aestiaquae]|uniref:CHAP domain-containing protein n=1 Tax=Pontixanthobacter aestiaquae TaxID=1509367 RepID=A0A844Z7R9_9SPHN|nr:CHAP domain-containing protein [Pontixanthobacter aestiaquae]MDN3646148.1 CHAP domain-containing protein [Pontixanthobacter aestiaquae]MXO82860.1 CHAP domain-containing protein [Pontixanthobacter aestiaquae]
MLHRFTPLIAAAALVGTITITASRAEARESINQSRELPPYLQCVPYAREVSGINIYGDAYTWWKQAEGRFKRGNRPKVGAVMAFEPHGNMQLGHVAAVSKIVNSRTILLRHSNWSPINGRRGQIENDVRAVDVSPGNDWSEVRVWYHPIQALGKTAWPIHGFIYSDTAPNFERPSFSAPKPRTQIARAPAANPVSRKPSRAFASAFASLSAKPAQRVASHRAPRPTVQMTRVQHGNVNDRVKAAVSLYD